MKRKWNRTDWIIAGVALLVFATIIQTKSESHKESLSDWRFWLIIAIFAVFHVVAIIIINFPELKSGLILLLFALVDGFVMWFLINWIERLVLSQSKNRL